MKQYRDEIAMVCHEIMEDGYRLGKITDEEMRDFEDGCFVETGEPVITSSKSGFQYQPKRYVAATATRQM